MPVQLTRREVLGSTIAGGAAGLVGFSPAARAKTRPGLAVPRFQRHSAFSAMGQQMLVSYAKGVAQMKAWSASDPTNKCGWDFQVAMHGIVGRADPLWNQCAHSTWWFLPWHRAFIWHFERIVRAASGDPEFTLPYWPWDDDSTSALPPEFFLDPTSPLWHLRNPDINNGDPMNPSLAQATTDALDLPDFLGGSATFGFGGYRPPERTKGDLERFPHDAIHSNVQGDMQYTVTAADDPVFWLHHCNIDRLWDEWLARGNMNPTDADWLDALRPDEDGDPLKGLKGTFVNPDASTQEVTTSDVLTGGFVYDYSYVSITPVAVAMLSEASVRKVVIFATPKPRVLAEPPEALDLRKKIFDGAKSLLLGAVDTKRKPLKPGPDTVQTQIAPDRRPQFDLAMKLVSTARVNPPAVHLVVTDVQAAAAPGVVYRVFLNVPDANSKTDPASANYVGMVTLFMRSPRAQDPRNPPGQKNPPDPHAQHDHANQGRDYRFNITQLVRRLQAAKKFNPNLLQVTLVPVGVGKDRPDAEVSIGKVEIRVVQD